MLISFVWQNKEYTNFDISDPDVRQKLQAEGVDLKAVLIENVKTKILSLAKKRLQDLFDQYGYNSLGDVQLYASQNDPEAQAILNFYTNANSNGYDDLLWNYIDSLATMTKMSR